MLGYAAVAIASASGGLLLGGMLASAKTGELYDRLDEAEAAHRAQTVVLQELVEALRLILDEVSEVRSNNVSDESYGRARQILMRLSLPLATPSASRS